MGTGSAMNLKVISRSCSDHAPSILQTCFNQLPIDFRHISTLFRNFPNHSRHASTFDKQVYLRKAQKTPERIKQGPTRNKACKGDSLAARFACGSLALKNGKGTPDRFPTVLQTCFIQVPMNFRYIATLFRFVSYRCLAKFDRIVFFSPDPKWH